MQATPWYRSLAALIVVSVLLPPLGLVLIWARPGTRLPRKILDSLYVTILGVVYLHYFFGLRIELDGTGIYPIFSFYNPESHFTELERNRLKQRESPPVASTVSATDQQIAQAKHEVSRGISESHVEAAVKTSKTRNSRSVADPYWTDFRGPRRDGRYDELPVATEWPSQGLPLLWRQPVGGGYASFVIAKGRAFTIEQRRHQEVVAAYDVETGREIWTHSWDAEFRESMGGDGPRATPTWNEGRLYALGATGELHCLQAESGRLVWARNILKDNQAENLTWGMAASPLIVDEKVIVLPGGSPGKSVVAYHKVTGNPVWKALDDRQAYTSPMLVTLAGRRQILVVSARRAIGLAVEDGAALWDYPWVTEYGINSAQPIVLGENRLFLSAGYGHGSAVVEVTPNDKGFTARTVWENTRLKNKFGSSVLDGGYVYGLDESILACIDAGTGELKWKGGRYGYGQLVLASGHLIVLTESGELVLVKATPEGHQELARFPAIEGKTWNHPALAGGRLLVRNANQMACFNLFDARRAE
jgi:outer membrane protein assembly factor BamB